MNNLDFLNELCESAWLNHDPIEAWQIAQLFRDELSTYQVQLLNELIFGVELENEKI